MEQELVWKAVDALADIWRAEPTTQTFVRPLPRTELLRLLTQNMSTTNAARGPLTIALENVASIGSTMSNPLLLASLLPMVATVAPEVDLPELSREHPDWFAAAAALETAQRLVITWLRSRLPRYPLVPAPQLAPNTTLTTKEFTYRIVWPRPGVEPPMQFADVPPGVASALGMNDRGSVLNDQAVRALHHALAQTPEWTRLVATDRDLTPATRTALVACRKRIKTRLSDDQIDAHDPRGVVRRDEYRRAVMSEEISSLEGPEADFADAFAEVDHLIEFAAGTIFAQLLCYPVLPINAQDLETTPGHVDEISFRADHFELLTPVGSVVWLEDPLITDAVHLRGQKINFGIHGEQVRYNASVLRGTASLRA